MCGDIMFFDVDVFSANVIDVLDYKESPRTTFNEGRSFWAISYRKDSTACIETEKNTLEVGKHSILLVPAYVDYTRISDGDSMKVIHFMPNPIPADGIRVFYPSDYSKYEKYFARILEAWNNKGLGYRYKCNEYLMRICSEICFEDETDEKYDTAQRMACIIEKHIHDFYFGIEDLNGKFNMSATYLRKKFKERFGISPCAYLAEKRMEHAASLIETGYFSIKEVAARCGFENEKYFSVVFKKHYGIKPSEYNKWNKKYNNSY